MMQSLDAPAPLLLSQTSSDKLCEVSNRLSYKHTSQTADSEMNIQRGLLLWSWNKSYSIEMLFQLPYRSVFAEKSITKYQTHLQLQAQGDFQQCL